MENQETEQKEKSDMQPRWQYRPWRFAWLILAIFIVLIGFMAVGAAYHSRFERGEFGAQRIGFAGGMRRIPMGRGGRSQAVGADRILGAVTAINGDTLTVRAHGADQPVAVSSTTSFYKNGAIAKQSDVAVDDVVTVIGKPDSSGTIQATAITVE